MFLQEQAERFFNAFEVLHESNQALINRLSNPSGITPAEKVFGTRPAMGVDIVCLAFSVELYIKDLHLAIAREVPRGHNILELFKKLPERVQHEVFTYRSIANYGWSFPQFEKEMRDISDGFEKWRYSHEVTTVRYNNYFALVLIEAIKSIAASARNA